MGRDKKFQSRQSSILGVSIHPKEFVFVDRRTGTRRFEVKADKYGRMPVEQAVSLLAIHCVARQQTPGDFGVMVAAGQELFDQVAERAAKLIQACSGTRTPGFPLSRRQREVLTNVALNLSNKEIAAKLNISVRTIKFHVSTLLEKFDVRGRVDLMLESAAFLPIDSVHKRASSPEPIALARVPPMALLSSPATTLLLTAPVNGRGGRTIGGGKRASPCSSEAVEAIGSPRAAS
jgi:DNA-binding CsgD family transcriptional regulator